MKKRLVSFGNLPRKTQIMTICVAIIVISCIAYSFYLQSTVTASSLSRVEMMTKETNQIFSPNLSSLGITGVPTINSGCSVNKSGNTWLFETEMDCSSTVSYPSNFTVVLTPAQLTQFSTNAKKLDVLFSEQGWTVGKGPQSFSALAPQRFAVQYHVATVNADYYKKFNTELGAGGECNLIISLTSPQNHSHQLELGAVLNVVTYECSQSVTYPTLNL